MRGFATDPTGHDDILDWLESFGTIDRIGVEGTGTYGAGLSAGSCRRHDIDVVEVTRGDRQERRSHGKSDPVDAVAAARRRAVWRSRCSTKSRTGSVEAMRALRLVRRSATRDRTGAVNQMRALVVTAPDEIREAFRGVTIHQLVTRAARLRPADPTTVEGATKFSLRELARRAVQALDTEIERVNAVLGPLVATTAPGLIERRRHRHRHRRHAARHRR